jgi:hypothetical protein
LVAAAFGPEAEFVVALEAAAETALRLHETLPLIKAYLDGPKSLDELQSDVETKKKGYDVHHIVAQTPARDRRYFDFSITLICRSDCRQLSGVWASRQMQLGKSSNPSAN